MFLVLIIYNILIALGLFFFLTVFVKKSIDKVEGKKNKRFLIEILLMHTIIGFFHYLFIFGKKVDANNYYNLPKGLNSWFSSFDTVYSTGVEFVYFLIYPFAKLEVAFYNVFLFFSILSLIGFYKLFFLFKESFSKYNLNFNWMVYFLFLLPSFHFFITPIGKDVIIFFALVSIFVNLKDKKIICFSNFILLFSLLIIRPHIFIFLIVAYSLSVFFSSKTKAGYKLLIIIIGLLILFLFASHLKTSSGVDIFSSESIGNLFDRLNGYANRLSEDNSVLKDIKEKPFYVKMLVFSFLPLFWKIENIMQLVISFENLVLIIIFFKYLFSGKKLSFFKDKELYLKVIFLYAIITWVLLGQTIYNLGLATRQKYMYIPFLYFIIILFLLEKKSLKKQSKSIKTLKKE